MTTLNKTAAEISQKYTVHAATDVTGFGFLGHLHEMMGRQLSCIIDGHAVPVLPGAWDAADACLYTAAGQRNRNHTGAFVTFEGVPFPLEEILFDPQTSVIYRVSVKFSEWYLAEQAIPTEEAIKDSDENQLAYAVGTCYWNDERFAGPTMREYGSAVWLDYNGVAGGDALMG